MRISRFSAILAAVALVTVVFPTAVAYHGSTPPDSVDPAGGAYVVGIVPGGRQEMPGDPAFPNGDNDLPEFNGADQDAYVAPPPDGGGFQNLQSDELYWCGSGFPVGDEVNGLIVGGADPANETGPIGHYEIDAVWAIDAGTQVTQDVDDHLLARELSDNDPGQAPYYYGADIFYATEEKPRVFPPGIMTQAVFLYCTEAPNSEVPSWTGVTNPDPGFAHPTQILPQNITKTEVTAGDFVTEETGAVRGLFGYDDLFEWTSSSSFGEDFREWTFFGSCDPADGVIFKPGSTRTCDAYPGIQVLDSAWYYGSSPGAGFLYADYAFYPLNFRYTVNPSQTLAFPGYYNSLWQDTDLECVTNGGDAAFGNCGQNLWVFQNEFPPVATSTDEPRPVVEDIDLYGRPPAADTLHPVIFEGHALWRVGFNCLFRPTCPVDAPAPTPSREFEPNHPEDPDEFSAVDADGHLTFNVSQDGWGIYLDAQKWTYIVTGGLNFDPFYSGAGANGTMACSYDTSSDPHRPAPSGDDPCNRRDVYPAGFYLVADFGFARDHATTGQPDGIIDQRFAEEWVGFPDLTWDPQTLDYFSFADVGFVGNASASGFGGNDAWIDTPSGEVIVVQQSCNVAVDNNVGTGSQNLYQPATVDTTGSGTSGIGGVESVTVANGDYTSLPLSNPDIEACNPDMGAPSEGWGTFVGCRDVMYERGCNGEFDSNVRFILADGFAGLVRTSVSARVIVPDGGFSFKGAKNHGLASVLEPGEEFVLTDVDYFGGRI